MQKGNLTLHKIMATLKRNEDGTYTVREGNTLSGIAKGLGVDQSAITGFSSGDPNKIYPDEVLNLGDGQATQSTIPQPTDSFGPNPQPPGGPVPLTPQPTNQNPYAQFNLAIMDMLKQAQGTTNEDDYRQVAQIERLQNERSSALTSEENRLLSPDAQARIRNADITSLNPAHDAALAKIQADEQRVSRFATTIAAAKDFGESFDKHIPASEETIEAVRRQIRAGIMPNEDVMAKVRTKLTEDDYHAFNESRKAEKSTKPPTQGEFVTAAYAARLEQSNPILSKLENSISGMSLVDFKLQEEAPSTLQTPEFQSYDQAARNFINANLRKESGAAISPEEFKNARIQYLPQPGDAPDTLKQKRENRQVVEASFKSASGEAFQSSAELLGSVGGGEDLEDSTGGTVTLLNPNTGEVRDFPNLSPEDLQDALSQGFIQQ